MSSQDPAPVVELRGITKRYPGVTALDQVDFDLRPGEVHALVGENGAGKSTLAGVLTGSLVPDEGQILLEGRTVRFDGPAAARRLGIVGIAQELAIEPYLTVSDNIVLGREPTVGPARQVLSRRLADAIASRALASLGGSGIPLDAPAGHLSTARKQLVEIARALAAEARIILMDEPTASLPGNDAARLLQLVRELRADGKAILYISHRLEEVRDIADRVTVVRGGRHIGTLQIEDAPIDRMIELMVGRSIGDFFPPRRSEPSETVLEIEGMTRLPVFRDVSLQVRRGEILGIAGLVGAGRTELMRAIAGADPRDAGIVRLLGKELAIAKPSDAIGAGIVYLPEDRADQGLVLSMSVCENVALPSMTSLAEGWGLLRRGKVRDLGRQWCAKLEVLGRLDAPVATLSGGNRQKVVIAKWAATTPTVLIFDEPTRGIDVGAKRAVFQIMHDLAANGAAIVFVSSEIPELMNVAHRILVMSAGKVTDELDLHEFAEERILTAAFAGHVEQRADG